MAQVIGSRMSVEMEGEFVVFLIGTRVNKPWKLHKWLPVFLAMPKMLKELEAHPESGCLVHSGLGRVIVQYWRSFEPLEAYARAKDKKHWPAWVDFNRRVGNSRSDVGICTKLTSSSPANTRPYTVACLRMDSVRWANWLPRLAVPVDALVNFRLSLFTWVPASHRETG
jgi:hypothetical protein